ncbi:citrate synthase/methylcitrate synthase [Lihuaxuella thermophila]|uniref:Citrate synthase n=1 Tax=Lihuaxuella thermophila TaxID=1173111 RepID=A0A1H8AMD2_9BACL|nr:citrate synthase/methylcitrate synthase [Lihuaxuella thermophila]SEM70909.1 citrate synthase [Lihuaxuella thermophila]
MRVNPGLDGVVVTDTEISEIDGQAGTLIYRGWNVDELAVRHTFEEVVYLLWNGEFPEPSELDRWRRKFGSGCLSDRQRQMIRLLSPEIDMISVIRTILSSLGDSSFLWPPTAEKGIKLLAAIPVIIAARTRSLQGKTMLEPREDLSFAANYLYMLKGTEPLPAHVKALEAYWILTAEHGLNASTFTARVAASTETDLASAVIAALSALKGPIHGGAPSHVDDMLDKIGSVERAESWIRERLLGGEKLMGFGHRIYKTTDPRAEALREVVRAGAGEEPWFQLAVEVEKIALAVLREVKPNRQIHTNVEYYTAAILKAIELPRELYTPTFAVSRTAGWIAHILEQAANNRIIRPSSRYIGPKNERIRNN